MEVLLFSAMDKIWKFDGSMTSNAIMEAIQKMLKKVGYKI
jgi:thiamine biosynthesis lipoprotein